MTTPKASGKKLKDFDEELHSILLNDISTPPDVIKAKRAIKNLIGEMLPENVHKGLIKSGHYDVGFEDCLAEVKRRMGI